MNINVFTVVYIFFNEVLCYKSTLEAMPNGIAFISERRQRNSPITHVIATQDNCRIHHEGDVGHVELYIQQAKKCSKWAVVLKSKQSFVRCTMAHNEAAL